MNTHQQKIESLLFYKNEPLSITYLSRELGISVNNTKEELEDLKKHYENRGIELLVLDDMVSLVTNKATKESIQKLESEEQAKELSKQALETLAIIMYKNGVTKAEIDYLRGVNSVYILRNLSMRGLIEKKANKEDKRSPLYRPSFDLMSYLGISEVSELPDYQQHIHELEKLNDRFISEQEDNEA